MTIKVLVVDDMAIYRSVISSCIRDVDGLEVVGTARDGTEVQQYVKELQPDIITLDMEMPGMGGIDVLREMKGWPITLKRPKVVVFSGLSEAGAAITVEALSLGATDFMLKPTSSQGVKAISEGLIPKLLALGASTQRTTVQKNSVRTPVRPATRGLAGIYGQQRKVLAIASSTGGPQALEIALQSFPADFPLPILIVQHMPPLFTKTMAERFDSIMDISVCEAQDGMVVQPGHAYIAPGDFHMRIKLTLSGALQICLDQSDKKYGLRPAADRLFESLTCMSRYVLSAVFTGMGRDGTDGLIPLHTSGAAVLAQKESSCVVYGMPRAVDEAELTHEHFTPETFYQTVSRYMLKV